MDVISVEVPLVQCFSISFNKCNWTVSTTPSGTPEINKVCNINKQNITPIMALINQCGIKADMQCVYACVYMPCCAEERGMNNNIENKYKKCRAINRVVLYLD